MKGVSIIFSLITCMAFASGQGFNHQWLLGTGNWANVGRLYFDTASYVFQVETRKMRFNDTQGNISDVNGNFLMSSNGVWIANANNDTMLNGTGLNPSAFTSAWNDGLPIANGNLFVPYPADSTKYVLFHQTGDSLNNVPSTELYYSVIDLTLDSGLGGVISKNNLIFHDTLSWGIGACKHANGRDWWIIAIKDNSNKIYKLLFTPSGIDTVSVQITSVSPLPWGNVTQPSFSPDGSKFAFTYSDGGAVKDHYLYLFDFDRCSGLLFNQHIVDLQDGSTGVGITFAPNSQFVYATSVEHIFQINLNTLFVDTIATYDGFCFPNPPWCTTFDLMYLAPNGKIYITSGNGVQHIHEINSPDNNGIACDVQQHAVNLNGIWNFRTVPNHPNYYLGRLQGSPCDTLQWTGLEEPEHDFRFRLYPNPISNSTLNIGYLLPPNKSGTFQIYDITGKIVFKYNLPPWSNEQSLTLPKLSNGIYQCLIKSENSIATKKLIVIKE